MKIVSSLIALCLLAAVLVGCSGGSSDDGGSTPATPQSVGNSAAPSQLGATPGKN